MRIAFTGKRAKDLAGYDERKYKAFIEELKAILRRYGDGNTYICGGAQGFDQLAFEATKELKTEFPNTKVHLYIPFRGQERKWLETGYFSQAMYYRQMQEADETILVEPKITDQSPFIEITRALFKRNEAMVNNADIIIALYPDDNWRTAKGGTPGCMKYAYGKKPLYQLKYTINSTGLHVNGELTKIE